MGKKRKQARIRAEKQQKVRAASHGKSPALTRAIKAMNEARRAIRST